MAVEAGVDDLAHMIIDHLSNSLITKVTEKNIYWVPTLELWYLVSGKNQLNWEAEAIDNLHRFAKAGGKVALGTDIGGYPGAFDRGMPFTEIQLMQKAGMTAMQIIVAATKNAAYVCDLKNELGTIEVGKIADILIVKKNPLQNLNALKQVYMVIHNGEIIQKENF
jgi:imidazolonepropionase-like amidohydrolase